MGTEVMTATVAAEIQLGSTRTGGNGDESLQQKANTYTHIYIYIILQ